MAVISVDERGPLCLFCYGADTRLNWVSLLLSHLGPQMEIPAQLVCRLPGIARKQCHSVSFSLENQITL